MDGIGIYIFIVLHEIIKTLIRKYQKATKRANKFAIKATGNAKVIGNIRGCALHDVADDMNLLCVVPNTF